eukprot:239272-Chlamydomonas_euryale.AAC.1
MAPHHRCLLSCQHEPPQTEGRDALLAAIVSRGTAPHTGMILCLCLLDLLVAHHPCRVILRPPSSLLCCKILRGPALHGSRQRRYLLRSEP